MRRALAALLVLGCAPKSEPPPDAPDIGALTQRWTLLTGNLAALSGEALARHFVEDAETIAEELRLLLAAFEAQGALGDDGGETGSAGEGLAVRHSALTGEAGGWARITWVCPGRDGSVSPANGRLVLHSVFDLDGIKDRLVWGVAESCVLWVEDSEEALVFDGELRVWLGEQDGDPIVTSFAGELNGAGFDFELGLQTGDQDGDGEDDGGVVLLQSVGDEVFRVTITGATWEALEGGSALPLWVEDARGEWRCDIAVDGSSGRCAGPEEAELSW